MTRRARLSGVLALAAVSAGCLDTVPPPAILEPPLLPPTSTVVATFNGSLWASGTASGVVSGERLTIFASDGIGTPTERRLSIMVDAAVGAQTLGPSPGTGGPTVNVLVGPPTAGQSWWTFTSGSSGTITVLTLTSTRATGTFEFVARAISGSVTPAEMRATSGTFDVRLTVLP